LLFFSQVLLTLSLPLSLSLSLSLSQWNMGFGADRVRETQLHSQEAGLLVRSDAEPVNPYRKRIVDWG